MIAPLKVSSNHIATTFLSAQTNRREQVAPRARLRGLRYFADGDPTPRVDAAERSYRRKIRRASCAHRETRPALDDPAPRMFDQSSWTKWNKQYGRTPVPPLSKRRIPGVDPATVPFFPPSLESRTSLASAHHYGSARAKLQFNRGSIVQCRATCGGTLRRGLHFSSCYIYIVGCSCARWPP
jgi:hypothetical protein